MKSLLLPSSTNQFLICAALTSAAFAISLFGLLPKAHSQPPITVANVEPKKKPPFPDLIFADHRLLNSIAREDVGALKMALELDGSQLNVVHKSGYTPLSAAARTGNKELVQILLDKGAKNEAAGSPQTGYNAMGNPLLSAAASGSIEVMRLLLEKGGDLKASQNASILNSAVQNSNREMIDFLLDKGAKIDGNPDSGYTPLVTAVQGNLPEMVQYLITKGARVNPSDRASGYYGYSSPLYSAVLQGKAEMVELLMKNGADPMQEMRGDSKTPLSYAISYGRRDVVEAMLTKEVNLNQKDRRGQAPLHLVLNSDGAMIKLLLDKGANINERNSTGQTPLHVAAKSGSLVPLKILLDNKADLTAKTPMGDTPLHLAVARPTVATALLAAGAKPNVSNARGDLPLHVALRLPLEDKSKNLREENLKLRLALVENSDVNAKDQFGLTPLQIALLTHQPEVREAILVKRPNMDNITAFFDAASRNDAAELKKQLDAKPYLNFMRLPNGVTPLHVAAQWGANDAIDYLLKKGADINARDGIAATPLLRVLSPETGPPDAAAGDIVNYLLGKGADTAVLDEEDEGVLHIAIRRGDKRMVSLLLNKGASPNVQNLFSQSPLDLLFPGSYISRTRRSAPTLEKEVARELVALLLDKGADQTQSDTQGNTPLLRAAVARDAEMLTLLLDKGANVNTQNTQGETALARLASYASSASTTAKQSLEAAKVLIDKGADVNVATQYGETILSRALSNGNRDFAKLLIEKGADLSATRPGSEPLIFRIISMGDNDLLATAIEKKVDLSVKDNLGNTPLMRAVTYGEGKIEIVETLLKAGADPNVQTQNGQTALDLVRRGNNEMIELLKAHGAKEGKKQ